ncbi:hypothetical protein ACFTWH_35370 [Streptomyces sp. NPDC057011]|uniref:hypothetical protein n=1 Tax=unclassified Streptomyces TaxID=2593676 RepID=UPI00363550FF
MRHRRSVWCAVLAAGLLAGTTAAAPAAVQHGAARGAQTFYSSRRLTLEPGQTLSYALNCGNYPDTWFPTGGGMEGLYSDPVLVESYAEDT